MKLAVAMLLTLAPSVANADVYACTGPVSSIALNQDGMLTVTVGTLANVFICRIDDPVYGITTETCRAIYSLLLAAKLLNKPATFSFNDSLNSCTNHPAWAQLTGWYYGPEVQ